MNCQNHFWLHILSPKIKYKIIYFLLEKYGNEKGIRYVTSLFYPVILLILLDTRVSCNISE